MPNGQDPGKGPEVYHPRPPEWLPKAHVSADLGYLGYDPPRRGQDEDLLTEKNIKDGYSVASAVGAETFSGQAVVKPRLQDPNALTDLESLMNQVLRRRAEKTEALPSPKFRMPGRVTQTDTKKHQWLTDLADPLIPLNKLGKSVPHGAKGADLLDLLHNYKVPISRAVWFLRVFGANETGAQRNKPFYNPTQYSVDWATVVNNYLKKQLDQIALPSAPRLSLNIKHTFKGVLAEQDSRDRWVMKFVYSLDLLRVFYSEGLVDNRTFLWWLVQNMANCNLAQATFIAMMADEYLDGLLVTRALARPFVEACLGRLAEVNVSIVRDGLDHLEGLLIYILQRSALAAPSAFVGPRMWLQYSETLVSVLSKDLTNRNSELPPAAHELASHILSDITMRNESLLFHNLPPRVLASVGSAVSDAQLLNSICASTNMDFISFLEVQGEGQLDGEAAGRFASKLDTLLTWSVTRLQYGDHRTYAAVTIISRWYERMVERAARRLVKSSPREALQDYLFDWLDSSAAAAEVENLPAIARLFGELVEKGLFSHSAYIERLIARGERGLSFSTEPGSRHRPFLRWMPLHRSTPALVNQRKVALHGVRARGTPEDVNEREMRKEIRMVLTEVFGGEPQPTPTSMVAVMSICPTLSTAPRYECVKVIRQWLLPILRKHVANNTITSPENAEQTIRTLGLAICLMEHLDCYGSILDLIIAAIENATTSDALNASIETLRRFEDIWVAKNVCHRIVNALYTAHGYWRHRGVHHRLLLRSLVEMDQHGYLDSSAKDQVTTDINALVHALAPIADPPDANVPVHLPEILMLAADSHADAPSMLANSLWFKYRSARDWAWKVWDNTVASLRQLPALIPDRVDRRACAMRYASFLLDVDQHTPFGFDDQVLHWFLGAGKTELAGLTADVWDVLIVVLVSLAMHGALTTTGILQGVVYPTWQAAAKASSQDDGLRLSITLDAVNDLFSRLMLSEEANNDGTPPMDLVQLRRIQARRQEVHRDPHFEHLVSNVPVLVFMERNYDLSEHIRATSAWLRVQISRAPDFRQGAYRNLDAVQKAFAQTLESDGIASKLHQPLVNALRLVFNDTDAGHPDFANTSGEELSTSLDTTDAEGSELHDIASLLTPWKIAATGIVLQFTLRQWGEELSDPASQGAATAKLNKFMGRFFHVRMTFDQADFIAELAKGTSPAVVGRFINSGLRCITEILANNTLPLHGQQASESMKWAGDIMRLLSYMICSLRAKGHLTPPLDTDTQDTFVPALCSRFQEAQAIFEGRVPEISTDAERRAYTPCTIFLARMLQFHIGLPRTWTSTMQDIIPRLTSTLFSLMLLHGGGPYQDLVAFPLLLDTYQYLLDEIPADGGTTEPFSHYPRMSMSDLPPAMPAELCAQIRFLLPYVDQNPVVADLVQISGGTSSCTVPVQNRPWEWIEHIGEPSPVESTVDDDRTKARHSVKNSASLSLDLFAARATGDGILGGSSVTGGRIEANLRSFEDSLSLESVFRRDWRETRMAPKPPMLLRRGEEDDEVGPLHTIPKRSTTHTNSRSGSRRTSPASSAHSLGSLQRSGSGSLRPSPAQNATPRQSSGTKRKQPLEIGVADNDSDIEILDGPALGASTRALKKPKTQAPSKATRGKKR